MHSLKSKGSCNTYQSENLHSTSGLICPFYEPHRIGRASCTIFIRNPASEKLGIGNLFANEAVPARHILLHVGKILFCRRYPSSRFESANDDSAPMGQHQIEPFGLLRIDAPCLPNGFINALAR
jgi:hypothetical protein